MLVRMLLPIIHLPPHLRPTLDSKGDFNYVVFSSVQLTTKIVVTGTFLETVASGLLVLGGIVCVIVGIVVAIVGAVQKNPAKKATISEDEYYAKRGSNTG